MAREPALLDDSDTPESTEQRPGSADNTVLLDRRSYLRIAGAATAATLAATTGVGASEDYETITLSRGERRTFEVGNGETFENKLIDCTAGNCWPVIVAHGTNWTIRNVGIEGRLGNTNAIFGVSDRQGNTSVMENIYLGDGSDSRNGSSTGHGQTAIWANPDHAGHIDIENVNIQGFADNAIYASAPGNGGGGTVHIDSCFAANCYVSHYRLATAGSTVTNSSVYVNDEGFAGRGIWAWSPGTIEIEDCQIEMNGHHTAIDAGANGQGTDVVVRDSDYDRGGITEHAGSTVHLEGDSGTSPEAFVPDGTPTSAEEAASGD